MVIKRIEKQSMVKYKQKERTVDFNPIKKYSLFSLFITWLKSILIIILIPMENKTVMAVKNKLKTSVEI